MFKATLILKAAATASIAAACAQAPLLFSKPLWELGRWASEMGPREAGPRCDSACFDAGRKPVYDLWLPYPSSAPSRLPQP
jgi:hypothetical protein